MGERNEFPKPPINVTPINEAHTDTDVGLAGQESSIADDAMEAQNFVNVDETVDEGENEVDLSTLGLSDKPIHKKKKKARGKKGYRKGQVGMAQM